MDAAEQTVSSLLLPLNGCCLILPQAGVAEITQRPEVTTLETTPAWLKGIFNWRAEQVALISFELLNAETASAAGGRAKVAVLYGLEGLAGLSFYALELHATPQPLKLAADTLGPRRAAPSEQGLAMAEVVMGGQRVVIPNLARIESLIGEQLERL